jgi:hypothetical protein
MATSTSGATAGRSWAFKESGFVDMATHFSHAALPFPVKGARYTVPISWLAADGTPTDPSSPDSEVSKDGGAFADCTEEATIISGATGAGYLTLTGAEMNATLVKVAAKGTGPKTTLIDLAPRVLPIVLSGTATAGSSSSITLPVKAHRVSGYYTGCIVRTTGGTGGGGTGGANNQARMITNYVGTTRVATIEPAWETTPDATTTVEVLHTEIAVRRSAQTPYAGAWPWFRAY